MIAELKKISEKSINEAMLLIDKTGIPRPSLNSLYWVESNKGIEYPFKHLTREAYSIETNTDKKLVFGSSPETRNVIENLGFKINYHKRNLNFFRKNELIDFKNVAGTKYRKADPRAVRYGELIFPNVKKLNYWADASLVEDFVAQTDNHWQWSGSFKKYLWVRIYRKSDSKKVFFVFGINDMGELYVELNCQRSNHTGGSTQALSDEKVEIFDNFLNESNYAYKPLNHSFIKSCDWEKLIDIGRNYILSNAHLYDELELLIKEKATKGKNAHGLVEEKPPSKTKSYADRKRNFKGFNIDWGKRQFTSQKLGNAGEQLVIKSEVEKLTKLGLLDEAAQVEKVLDGEGYDIISFNKKKEKIYIEVKTTKAANDEPFYLSLNELEYCKLNQKSYFIYRLYNFNNTYNSASFYILSGKDLLKLQHKAINFEISI